MILDDFKQHCIHSKSDVVVQKFLIEESTYFFNEIKKGEEYNFKKEIAGILGVHIRDILIVGSGKLGFSLKPEKDMANLYKFRSFDFKDASGEISNKKSDLDVAIISSSLFDKEIENLYNHMDFYRSKWADMRDFAKFVLKGRLAIRYLPEDFPLTKGILKVQEKYKSEYGRVINIEIYKSWYYFETYHQLNIKNIQVNLLA